MWIKRRLIAALALAGLLGGVVLGSQPFPTEIQIAINQLVTGVVPFTGLRSAASSYVNWGATQGEPGYGFRDNAGTIQVKNSAGSWANIVTGATLPTSASFITRVAEGALTNETAMGALGTGLVINTTATGVPTIYAGVTCTNQFLRVLSAVGAGTCAPVSLTADITGTLAVANGGTGITSGTSGGVLYFNGAPNVIASSGALTLNQIVLGGGTTAPTVLGTTGTSTTVLHGNGGGAPAFAAVNLTTTVTGILPGANGGTNNGFTEFTGPAAALRTFTLPNASATILTSAAAVTAAQGGTGHATYATGDLLQASAATTLSRLAAVATGNALISGGIGTVSSWGKIGLTTHVSGTLPVANGGTSFASYTIGDLLSPSAATTFVRIAAVASGSYLRSAGVATLPVWSTATLPNTAATGDLIYASGANAYANLTVGAAGTVLVGGATPSYSANPTVTSLAATTTTNTQTAAGNTVQTLATATAGDDPTEITRQYRVATTDATPTAIATIPIPTSVSTQFECKVTARRTSGAAGAVEDSAGYLLQALYKNNAGTAAEVAAETLAVIGEDQAAWTIAIAPSTSNAVISVTGAANNDVTWHATCKSYGVGS